jgi:hypothetical protein
MSTKISSLTSVLLQEVSLDYRKKDDFEFKKSVLNDPHIKKIIDLAHTIGGKSIEFCKNHIINAINSKKAFEQYSPILYKTLSANAAEHAAFDLLEHFVEKDEWKKQRVKFDIKDWKELVDLTQRQHPALYPLYSPGRFNYKRKMPWILMPSTDPRDAKYNDVKTACVTKDGDFVFYKPFLQKLMDFAVIEKPKIPATDTKYQSNGGPIPDAYFYVEWVLMHEILHYSHGDFDNAARLTQYDHKTHNIAADLRINHRLAVSNKGQIPFGYISELINGDTHPKYSELVKITDAELKKLPQNLRDQVNTADEHTPGDQSGEQGQPEPSRGGESGQTDPTKGEKPGQADPTTGEKPGQDDQSKGGASPNAPGNNPEKVDPDEIGERVKNKMQQGTTSPSSQSGQKDGKAANAVDQSGKMTDMIDRAAEVKNLKPKINWNTILSKALKSPAYIKGLDYGSIDPRAVSYVNVAKDLGSMPITPASKKTEILNQKICLVLDTSASMMYRYPQVLAEAKTIAAKTKEYNVCVCMFSDTVGWFEVDVKNDRWWQLNSPNDFGKKPVTVNKKWKTLLDKGSPGATIFSSQIAADLKKLCGEGFNVILFTDSDIVNSSVNWKNFMSIYKDYAKQLFYIVDTNNTWRQSLLAAENSLNKKISTANWTSFEKR